MHCVQRMIHSLILCLMAVLMPCGLFAGQAPTSTPIATTTFRLQNGKDVVGEIISENKATVVIFNGAGNLALRVADIRSRTPGGDLEAASGSKAGLVSQVQGRPVIPPLRVVGAPTAEPLAGAVAARGQAGLREVLAEPEQFVDTLRQVVEAAGPGPTLIEIESRYQVRPVNRAEAYAVLTALEKQARVWLAPVERMENKELRAELLNSAYQNEETFQNGLIERLTLPDMRQLVALKRLVHGINKETFYTYAVNTGFTDLLNPRRPMGDCNASCALIYHLAWKSGFSRGLALFEDRQNHHAVLAMVCVNDSRHYFAETTGGFLSGNPVYQKLAEDPTTKEKTVISSLLNEGFPPGLSALDNLRLATILRVTSADSVSRNNFKHYFVTFLNQRLDAHDTAAIAQWSAVYDRIEGAGAFAQMPRTVVTRPAH